MSAKLRILLAGLLLVAAILIRWCPRENVAPAPAPPPPAIMTPAAPAVPASPAAAVNPAEPTAPPAPLAAGERQRVLDAIDNLQFTFRDYATALGGNPVGTNAEITASLLGDNAKQAKLPLPEGSTLNSQGELCDPWGSPWFFHQLSGTRMEIRSAGPDRVLYSDDDFVR